ncbi:MAG: protein-L-isoaspartate O-methyltransferase [Acidobacteriota bacterium]
MSGSLSNREMVRRHLAGRGVRSRRVLGAFLRVDRRHFIPPEAEGATYGDHPVSIGLGQTVSQPFMVALMLEHLLIRRGMRVLEVGSGSGYVLALLAAMGARPFGIEWHPELARRIEANCRAAGFPGIPLRIGDGGHGWREEAPFDRILVSACCPAAPPPLLDQVAPGGIFLAPVRDASGQTLLRITRTPSGALDFEWKDRCVFVPLLGDFGERP